MTMKSNKSRQLLSNREYQLTEDKVNWYSALKLFRSYKSVELCGFYETTSSAGDWSGYIVQSIQNKHFLILFYQENNYPKFGFTIYTGRVISSWYKGEKITHDLAESMIYNHIETIGDF